MKIKFIKISQQNNKFLILFLTLLLHTCVLEITTIKLHAQFDYISKSRIHKYGSFGSIAAKSNQLLIADAESGVDLILIQDSVIFDEKPIIESETGVEIITIADHASLTNVVAAVTNTIGGTIVDNQLKLGHAELNGWVIQHEYIDLHDIHALCLLHLRFSTLGFILGHNSSEELSLSVYEIKTTGDKDINLLSSSHPDLSSINMENDSSMLCTRTGDYEFSIDFYTDPLLTEQNAFQLTGEIIALETYPVTYDIQYAESVHEIRDLEMSCQFNVVSVSDGHGLPIYYYGCPLVNQNMGRIEVRDAEGRFDDIVWDGGIVDGRLGTELDVEYGEVVDIVFCEQEGQMTVFQLFKSESLGFSLLGGQADWSDWSILETVNFLGKSIVEWDLLEEGQIDFKIFPVCFGVEYMEKNEDGIYVCLLCPLYYVTSHPWSYQISDCVPCQDHKEYSEYGVCIVNEDLDSDDEENHHNKKNLTIVIVLAIVIPILAIIITVIIIRRRRRKRREKRERLPSDSYTDNKKREKAYLKDHDANTNIPMDEHSKYPDILFSQCFNSLNMQACTLCLGEFRPTDQVKKLKCQHIFHSACFARHTSDATFIQNPNCPHCDRNVNENFEI